MANYTFYSNGKRNMQSDKKYNIYQGNITRPLYLVQ